MMAVTGSGPVEIDQPIKVALRCVDSSKSICT